MTAARKIIVINPNSNAGVTESMDMALEPFRFDSGPIIKSVTNSDGPSGIESQQDADCAAIQVVDMIKRRDEEADAFVIACFSDPGIYGAREVTQKPVFGIAESGILTALSLGNSFGILAILDTSIPRHIRYIRSLGLEKRLAGDLAIGLGVAELSDDKKTFYRLQEVGKVLRDNRGASVLILGCAGMARYRQRLQESLEIPVVDPSQAAVSMAVSALLLDY
ncbi:MAG: aspartate/glutamate racemase family protein [Pseudomonadota bacterium]|jgi:allantoin racemase|nr:Asp/Glu racemase [Rhodospirillaceae bacterium]MEC7971725.1 aspartate/glutamate racemase family protein [Pseudomonadota bacterium]|tara:strand:+ start:689 stop:1354 length:666 start_codon:yes stop_codon:yes gene_type:complete